MMGFGIKNGTADSIVKETLHMAIPMVPMQVAAVALIGCSLGH